MIKIKIKSRVSIPSALMQMMYNAAREMERQTGENVQFSAHVLICDDHNDDDPLLTDEEKAAIGEAFQFNGLTSDIVMPSVEIPTSGNIKIAATEKPARFIDITSTLRTLGWDDAPEWATHMVMLGTYPAWANQDQFQIMGHEKHGPTLFDGMLASFDACSITEVRPTKEPAVDPFAVDWTRAPKWAKFHAFDGPASGGDGCWFKSKPNPDEHSSVQQWIISRNWHDIESSGFRLSEQNIGKWVDSLTRRPQVPCSRSES